MDGENIRMIPPPSIKMAVLDQISDVADILAEYGWLMLGGSILLLYLWNKFSPHLTTWLKEREDREFTARYHRDPDLEMRRQEAVDRARLKMAMQYEADAKKAADRRRELEERKREEWLLRQEGRTHPGRRLNGDIDNGPSGSSGNGGGNNKKKTVRLKEAYNPLMGGGARGYRPTRRSTCPSGGCG